MERKIFLELLYVNAVTREMFLSKHLVVVVPQQNAVLNK